MVSFVILLALVSCSTASRNSFAKNSRVISSISFTPSVDNQFIANSIGKKFVYVEPEKPDGVPNCVAAALRAGGYLPSFALNGTDDFYLIILPTCFEKQLSEQHPQKGDLGIIYENSVPTLAHAVLFLDEDQIFEKPSPQNRDLFGINSWKKIVARENRQTAEFQIWRFKPNPKCRLNGINQLWSELPIDSKEKLIAKVIEARIYNNDWTSYVTDISRIEIEQLIGDNRKNMEEWAANTPGGFNIERDYSTLYQFLYMDDLYKALLRTPGVR